MKRLLTGARAYNPNGPANTPPANTTIVGIQPVTVSNYSPTSIAEINIPGYANSVGAWCTKLRCGMENYSLSKDARNTR
jgi:hypothetical protein